MLERRNWAGNWRYGAREVVEPESVAEIQECVVRSDKVKAVGTCHSFNGVADTEGLHISLGSMNRVLSVDSAERTIAVEPGITYGDLSCILRRHGLALQNLASLPHISVAGACATATHGSGDLNGSLSTAVRRMEIVDARGEIRELGSDHPDFKGAVVHLGALGIVTSISLAVVPEFSIRQHVFTDMPFEVLESHFEEIFAGSYSVSLFTDWRESAIKQVWLKRSTDQEHPGIDFFGARAAREQLHPLDGMPSANCTPQLGEQGIWNERLPHFQMAFTPSAGEELQTEYLVPRSHAYEALLEVRNLAPDIAPLLYISEIRSVAADDLWMSMYYKRPSIGIHFTWKSLPEQVAALLPRIEDALAPFAARPHWGKLFARRNFCDLYEKLPEFTRLADTYDPNRKFRNAYLSDLFTV